MSRIRSGFVIGLAGIAAACHSGSGARNADTAAFRGPFVGANVDPTVKPARLLPEVVDETQSYGVEASPDGNGTRAIMAGLRVVTSADGAVVAAEDRLPSAPSKTIALPERLGGGFLFVLGTAIWRADRWLGPAKPIFTSTSSVQAVIPGLDRVYVRGPNVVTAIDGKTGKLLDLGPWPASPYVTSYAAADGWRAAAVADLRGAVATFDAGATWKTLDLPIEPKAVFADRDALDIGGFDAAKTEVWFEIRSDGSIARLGAPPKNLDVHLTPTPSPTVRPAFMPKAPPTAEVKNESLDAPSAKEDFDVKTFGKRPLGAAIEDGWPLTDGTAVVARDGALARIRLSDGALVEVVHDAFPLKPARCHPITLTRPTALGAFGFVCGEPRGATVLYAYDPLRGKLAELKRFDKPRVITSSGNGALAVRGSCAEDGEPTPLPLPTPVKLKDKDDERSKAKDVKPEEPKPVETQRAPPPATEIHPYCVLGHDDTWREIHVRGDVGGERIVVLADGRVVVVSPPQAVGAPARLTILDKGKATTVPIAFPKVTPDIARVLRLGLWLDGFEERRPGVIGGWIEAGGVILGLELGLDGKATPGVFDPGPAFVSGKYGLRWTASHRGYETTDGGMKWTTFDVPDPLVPAVKVERRACGPVGCLANGWLRVGWGEPKHEPPQFPPPSSSQYQAISAPSVALTCEPLAGTAPPVPAAKTAAHEPASKANAYNRGLGGSPVLSSFNGLRELLPFLNQPAPAMHDSEAGLNFDVRETIDRQQNLGNLGKIYAWGPKSGSDWDSLGRWQVKWLSPFYGWPEVKGSLPTLPPGLILDVTHQSGGSYYYGGYGSYGSSNYQLAAGDDGAHAMLVAKRMGHVEPTLFELEADRAPIEVHRADGEPFADIEGLVRVAGRWIIATPPGSATQMYGQPPPAPYTVLWQVEGGTARELVRVPRATGDIPQSYAYGVRTPRLARRSDGRAVGILAEGQPTPQRSQSTRWVLPIDLETGALGDPEYLGWNDLAGKPLTACTDDAVGWVVEGAMPGSSSVRMTLPHGSGSLQSAQARLRLSTDHACIERIAGTYDGQSPERTAELTRPGGGRGMAPSRPGDVVVSAMSSLIRYPLRCTIAK